MSGNKYVYQNVTFMRVMRAYHWLFVPCVQIASYEPQSFTELVYQLTCDYDMDLEKIR